ncbi:MULTISPECIES: hypothetical protein [Bacillus]|uniref:Uncharacterized protein n=1 Tax=Bacillus pumilus TaxID=1408 RepID=A0AB34QNY6_BACPU|nr:hypothetical protein [Bacillus pumilus]KIL12203.1 hypothetical protein B4127_1534 [Bacillus pumilus]
MLAARKDNVINFNKTVYARKIDQFGGEWFNHQENKNNIDKEIKKEQIRKSMISGYMKLLNS